MTKLTITTKTPDQIAAEFDSAFKGVPLAAKAKRVTHADRLEPYRKAIMKERKKGRSWEQIAAVMSKPPISEPASARLLHAVFCRPTAAPAPAPVPRQRLFLDPATGLPLPMDPATGRPIPQPPPRA